MSNKIELDEHNQLGYLYHYPKLNDPAPFQLDICLTKKPTEHHYDPQSVSVSVVAVNRENLIEQLTIVHPSSTKERRCCPGVVRMIDRKNKVEEALIFGGKLSIQSDDNCTLLVFTSKAPIIKITNTTKMNEMLRDEVEIQWAERRAHWLSQPEEFERRWVSADPLLLYRASLNALLEKNKNLRQHDPQGVEAMYYLQTRLARLDQAGFRMFPEPRLEDVL